MSKTTALLVIDFQTGLATGAYREHEVAAGINRLADATRSNDGIVVYIQHCHASYEQLTKGHPYWELHSELTPQAQDMRIEKTASDAFYETSLGEELKQQGITDLVITGLQTEYCVDTTCRRGLSEGFNVTLINDAHSTGDSYRSAADIIDYHNNILANVAHPHGAIQVISTEDYLTSL